MTIEIPGLGQVGPGAIKTTIVVTLLELLAQWWWWFKDPMDAIFDWHPDAVRTWKGKYPHNEVYLTLFGFTLFANLVFVCIVTTEWKMLNAAARGALLYAAMGNLFPYIFVFTKSGESVWMQNLVWRLVLGAGLGAFGFYFRQYLSRRAEKSE